MKTITQHELLSYWRLASELIAAGGDGGEDEPSNITRIIFVRQNV